MHRIHTREKVSCSQDGFTVVFYTKLNRVFGIRLHTQLYNWARNYIGSAEGPSELQRMLSSEIASQNIQTYIYSEGKNGTKLVLARCTYTVHTQIHTYMPKNYIKLGCVRMLIIALLKYMNQLYLMLVSTHIVAVMVSSVKLAFPSISTGWDITEDLIYSTQTHTNRYSAVRHTEILIIAIIIIKIIIYFF